MLNFISNCFSFILVYRPDKVHAPDIPPFEFLWISFVPVLLHCIKTCLVHITNIPQLTASKLYLIYGKDQ